MSPWATFSFSLTPVWMPSSPSQVPKPISEPPQPSPTPARMGTSFVLPFLKALAWNYLERERKRKSEIMEWNFNIFHIILGDKFLKKILETKLPSNCMLMVLIFTSQILLFRSWIQKSSPKNIQANWKKYSSELFQQCQRAQNWISRQSSQRTASSPEDQVVSYPADSVWDVDTLRKCVGP